MTKRSSESDALTRTPRRRRAGSAQIRAEGLPLIDFYEALGQRIRKTRETAQRPDGKEGGWKQVELAKAIRVDPAVLNRYENGRAAVSLDVLRRISFVLRVPLTSLLDIGTDVPIARPRLPPPKAEKRAPRKREEEILLRHWGKLAPRMRELALMMIADIVRASRKHEREKLVRDEKDDEDK